MACSRVSSLILFSSYLLRRVADFLDASSSSVLVCSLLLQGFAFLPSSASGRLQLNPFYLFDFLEHQKSDWKRHKRFCFKPTW